MKKFLLLISLFFFLLTTPKAFASVTETDRNPKAVDRNSDSITFTVTSNGNDIQEGATYTFGFFKDSAPTDSRSCTSKQIIIVFGADRPIETGDVQIKTVKGGSSKTLTATFSIKDAAKIKNPTGTWVYQVWKGTACGGYSKNNLIYSDGKFIVQSAIGGDISKGTPELNTQSGCSNFQYNTSPNFLIKNAQAGLQYNLSIEKGESKSITFTDSQLSTVNNFPTGIIPLNVGSSTGGKLLCLAVGDNSSSKCEYSLPITVEAADQSGQCVPVNTSNQAGQIPLTIDVPKISAPPPPCAQQNAQGQCLQVATAFGFIGTDAPGFIQTLFKILLGISGGLAIILIISSSYKIMTSQGEAEKVKEARESITSALVGLLFIIFSLVILQIIGSDILGIFAK